MLHYQNEYEINCRTAWEIVVSLFRCIFVLVFAVLDFNHKRSTEIEISSEENINIIGKKMKVAHIYARTHTYTNRHTKTNTHTCKHKNTHTHIYIHYLM